MKFNPSGRSSLIRLAASLPEGSKERRDILSKFFVSSDRTGGAKADKFLKELDAALDDFYGTKSHPPFQPEGQKREEFEDLVGKTDDNTMEDILFTIGRGMDEEYDDDNWGGRLPKLYLFIRRELK